MFPLKVTLADAVQQEAPKGVVEVLENLLLKIVANPIDALVNANYLGVLAWAVILGIVLKRQHQEQSRCFLMHLMRYLRQYDGL